MLIYIANFLSIPFYSAVFKNKKNIIWPVCTQMFLILAFRSMNLGSDIGNYHRYFVTWSALSLREMLLGTRFFFNHRCPWGLESGYVWLNWICAELGLNFQHFLVFHAFISTASLGYFLEKNVKRNYGIALAMIISLGVFQSYFYILRQMLALAVLFLSIEAVKKRNLVGFLFGIAMAVLFHRAAAVGLLLYYLYDKKISKVVLGIVYMLSIIVAVLVPSLYNYMVIPLLEKVGKAELYPLEDFQPNNMILLMAFFIFYVCVMVRVDGFFREESYRVGFWAGVLMLLLEVFSLYVPVISRISITLLLPFAIPMIADVAYYQKSFENKYILQLCSYLALLVLYIYQLKGSSIVPYKTFWQ